MFFIILVIVGVKKKFFFYPSEFLAKNLVIKDRLTREKQRKAY